MTVSRWWGLEPSTGKRVARTGRNPRTGAVIKIEQARIPIQARSTERCVKLMGLLLQGSVD